MSNGPNTGITGTITRDAQGRLIVQARGAIFRARALHPQARVGRAPVIGVSCSRGVLTGVVAGTPQRGDELVVRFVPEPEIRTGVRFNAAPMPVA
jgi:hypothetical protein